MVKVAINGFGRIGRPTLKKILNSHSSLDVAAINDLTDTKTLAHLFKYDSLYGHCKKIVKSDGNDLLIDGTPKGKRIKVFKEKDPAKLPWKKLGIDVVLECTGVFRDYQGAKKHIEAGAKMVIISAPSKTPEKIPSYVLGVNEDKLNPKKEKIVDMGSCTTNCLAPVADVLNKNLKIQEGFMTTIHSYTNGQRILDLPHRDLRRARAAAINVIPTTTGAAQAIGKVIPELNGKLDGMALRIPTPVVSIIDFVCRVEEKTEAKEVNYLFKKASKEKKLEGILGIEDALLVSSDYRGSSFSAVVDSELTAAQGNLVKVLAWYDNEWGYATRLAEFAEFAGKKARK